MISSLLFFSFFFILLIIIWLKKSKEKKIIHSYKDVGFFNTSICVNCFLFSFVQSFFFCGLFVIKTKKKLLKKKTFEEKFLFSFVCVSVYFVHRFYFLCGSLSSLSAYCLVISFSIFSSCCTFHRCGHSYRFYFLSIYFLSTHRIVG